MKKYLLAVLLLVGVAEAQRDNTFYVKEFDGTNVATKVTNAQAACASDTAIPCIIVFDPTLAVFAAGTLPARCTQCVWRDWRDENNAGGILNFLVSPYKWLELTPSQATAAKFNGTLAPFTNAGEAGQDNWVMTLGYNQTSGAGREDSSEPTLHIAFESNYNPSGVKIREFHLQHQDTSGVLTRPITYYKPDTASGDQLGLNSTLLILGNEAASVKAYFGAAGVFDWYFPTAVDDALVSMLRTDNNAAIGTQGTLKFQKGATAAASYFHFNNGGIRADGLLGIGAAPDSTTKIYVVASGTNNGMIVDGNASGILLAGRTSGIPEFQVSKDVSMFNASQLTTWYSGNQTGVVHTIDGATGAESAATLAVPAAPAAGLVTSFNESTWRTPCTKDANTGLSCSRPHARRNTLVMYNGNSGFNSMGDSATNIGTVGNVSAAAAAPAQGSVSTTAAANTTAAMHGNVLHRTARTNGMRVQFAASIDSAATSSRTWLAMTDQAATTMDAADDPAGNYAGFRWSSATDSFIKVCVKDNTTQNCVDTNVANLTTYHEFEIIENRTTSKWMFFIDGVEVGTVGGLSANIPTANTNLRYVATIENLTANARLMQLAWVLIEEDM